MVRIPSSLVRMSPMSDHLVIATAIAIVNKALWLLFIRHLAVPAASSSKESISSSTLEANMSANWITPRDWIYKTYKLGKLDGSLMTLALKRDSALLGDISPIRRAKSLTVGHYPTVGYNSTP
ncbi:hypothetical protein A2U01_0002346 [Trifolium medium]|uniref:Uncharacterized protein n=1 Tax=Trifolium medium TaxID=97028 RepID=A0A392M2R7_9FABA|nr:hypothetical protein [Trifolium medium]